MPDRFDKFVHNENIKSFTLKIETELDPVRLATLKTLLMEEEQVRPAVPRHKKA